MTDINLGPFNKGVNNQAQDYALPGPTPTSPGASLLDAYNVDITGDGTVKRRAGTTLVSSIESGHSLASIEGKTFLNIGDQIGVITSLDPLNMVTLRTGLTGSRVDYAGLAGEAWWSNGTDSGRCSTDNLDYPWVLPTPTPPVVGLGSGSLNPGLYRVSIAYSSAECGESAGCVPQVIELGDEGGINVVLPATPTGVDAINVYCTEANGGEMRLHASLPSDAVVTNIGTAPEGRSLRDRCFLSPLPAGDILAIHNGRMLSAIGDTLSYSEVYDFGLYNPAKNTIRFPASISIVAPCINGVYVVADKTYWLQGNDIAVAESIKKLNYGAVKGTRFESASSEFVGWFGHSGFVIASPDGSVSVPQDGKFSAPVADTGCVLLREEDGLVQLICSLDSSAAYYQQVTTAFKRRLQLTIADPSTVVMNLDNGATTRYTNFYMTSMCLIDGVYYGVDSTGLHQLNGEKDGTTAIQCEISLGRVGLKSDVLKHISDAYLGGMFPDGAEFVVRTPDDEYTYPIDSYAEAIGMHRAKTGKGLRYTWYDLSVRHVTGSYIELVSLMVKIMNTTRRI